MDQSAELREELSRLQQKLPTVDDVDIQRAMQVRIDEIEQQLQTEVAPVEVVRLKPGTQEEKDARAELTQLSRQLYSTEDTARRAEIQRRVGELQLLLGIDVAKMGSQEMSANAVPDLSVAARTPNKDKEKNKPRTNMADLQAILAEQSAKIRRDSNEVLAEIDVPENFEPATPEQVEAAEKLIQQARVETMRNNKVRAQELLEEAAKVAPGSSSVQEMLGDDYASRKLSAKAMAAYRRAVKLDPKNVNAERKLATMAISSDSAAAFQRSLGGNSESMASHRAAVILSIVVPGLGHLVMGKTVKGVAFLATWIVSLAWMMLQGQDMAKLFALPFGGRQHPSYLVVVPLAAAIFAFIGALFDLKKPEEQVLRIPAERPRPPMDLPFE